jgi:hypothetical protein
VTQDLAEKVAIVTGAARGHLVVNTFGSEHQWNSISVVKTLAREARGFSLTAHLLDNHPARSAPRTAFG